MSHHFESGFFVNKGAWHGLGKILDNPPNTAQAITEAGLDWQVKEQPIYTEEEWEFDSPLSLDEGGKTTQGNLFPCILF